MNAAHNKTCHGVDIACVPTAAPAAAHTLPVLASRVCVPNAPPAAFNFCKCASTAAQSCRARCRRSGCRRSTAWACKEPPHGRPFFIVKSLLVHQMSCCFGYFQIYNYRFLNEMQNVSTCAGAAAARGQWHGRADPPHGRPFFSSKAS